MKITRQRKKNEFSPISSIFMKFVFNLECVLLFDYKGTLV